MLDLTQIMSDINKPEVWAQMTPSGHIVSIEFFDYCTIIVHMLSGYRFLYEDCTDLNFIIPDFDSVINERIA